MTSDITLKTLLKTLLMDGAPAFLAHLGGTADMAPAPAEVPAVVFRRVDLLGTLPDQRMLHTEVPPRCGLRGAGQIIEEEIKAMPLEIDIESLCDTGPSRPNNNAAREQRQQPHNLRIIPPQRTQRTPINAEQRQRKKHTLALCTSVSSVHIGVIYRFYLYCDVSLSNRL